MKYPLDNLCRKLHRLLREARDKAENMRGDPNEIATAQGVAAGLEEAYDLACYYRSKEVK